jgi:hypothetical protein
MTTTLTIKLRNRKAKKILASLEELKLIKIMHDNIIPKKWSPKKKKQAKDFLSAYKQAKLAEEGKIKLKTAQSLIDEL